MIKSPLKYYFKTIDEKEVNDYTIVAVYFR